MFFTQESFTKTKLHLYAKHPSKSSRCVSLKAADGEIVHKLYVGGNPMT